MTEDILRRRRLATFAARGSRKLSSRQAGLVDTLLPQISVLSDASLGPDPTARNPGRPHPASLDPTTLFAGPVREVWFEIGFGGGEHLVEQARRNPDVGLIGCEPFLDGVAKALTAIEANGLTGVRLHHGDARDAMDALRPASLDRCFILFPDPWPKTRHHKRRLIQPAFLDDLASVMAPGGRLLFATDVSDYADWAMERFHAHPSFEWTARGSSDWRLAPQDHVATRYERKKLGDIAPVFFEFIRKPD